MTAVKLIIPVLILWRCLPWLAAARRLRRQAAFDDYELRIRSAVDGEQLRAMVARGLASWELEQEIDAFEDREDEPW